MVLAQVKSAVKYWLWMQPGYLGLTNLQKPLLTQLTHLAKQVEQWSDTAIPFYVAFFTAVLEFFDFAQSKQSKKESGGSHEDFMTQL